MNYPEKPAPTDLPLVDVIKKRWSPRVISDEPISEKTIAILFEAARWAPSSFNEQPWRYIYAEKNGPSRETLESLLVEGNAWAKNAGLLVISFAKKTFSRNGKENRHALHDLGCATGFIMLQATQMGLVTHQMAGFDIARTNSALDVPDDFVPGSMMAIGYPGDPEKLSPEKRESEKAPRTRRPVSEFAFMGKFSA